MVRTAGLEPAWGQLVGTRGLTEYDFVAYLNAARRSHNRVNARTGELAKIAELDPVVAHERSQDLRILRAWIAVYSAISALTALRPERFAASFLSKELYLFMQVTIAGPWSEKNSIRMAPTFLALSSISACSCNFVKR